MFHTFANVSAESDLPCQVLLRSSAPKLPQNSQTSHLQRPQVWEPLRNWNETDVVLHGASHRADQVLRRMWYLHDHLKGGPCEVHEIPWWVKRMLWMLWHVMAMAMGYDQRFPTSQAMHAASSQGLSWKQNAAAVKEFWRKVQLTPIEIY